MVERPATNKHEQKSELTRAKLRRATVKALNIHGYSETTLSAILKIAEVSSGALTHHYKSKSELIADTTDMLLKEATQRSCDIKSIQHDQVGAPNSNEELIARFFAYMWNNVVYTGGGRALIEILVAVRTDKALSAQLSSRLVTWDRDMNAVALELFESSQGGEDMRRLWGVCRIFLRGLILQAQFVRDPAELTAYVECFARSMAAQLQVSSPPHS